MTARTPHIGQNSKASRTLTVLITSLVLSACAIGTTTRTTSPITGGDVVDDANPGSASESAVASTAITSTTNHENLGGRMSIEIDGRTRSYILFVPPGHDVDKPAPLVINAHGAPSNPAAQAALSGFDELAAEEGVIVVYPAAVSGIWDFEDGDEMDRPDVNDLHFIETLIDEVSGLVSVDTDRIYALGFSMGAGISNLVACHLPEQIAAVVQVAGLMHYDGPACPRPIPIPVLAIIGEADPITTQGTQDLPFADQPRPADVEAEAWVVTNGCDPDPAVTQVSEDVTRSQYTCDAAPLVVYRHPGGHSWPAHLGPDIVTNELIWRFLSHLP